MKSDKNEIATRAEQMAEAVARMKILNIFPATIEQFSKYGKISYSLPPLGGFYWIEPEELEPIKKIIEGKYKGLIYNIIRTPAHMSSGAGENAYYDPEVTLMDSVLYVSRYKSEWDLDRADLNQNCAVVYVYNRSDPDMSEFGGIGFRQGAGSGLLRTY